MPRPIAAVEADLRHYTTQAKRLPDGHPDHATLHVVIDDLLCEREQVRVRRPSQVLARR